MGEDKNEGVGFYCAKLKRFNDFCHLLDKMLSENINKDKKRYSIDF